MQELQVGKYYEMARLPRIHKKWDMEWYTMKFCWYATDAWVFDFIREVPEDFEPPEVKRAKEVLAENWYLISKK